jgi:hypothetical protein
MSLQMEVRIKDKVTIWPNDLLYLSFDGDDDEVVIVCITRPDGSQQTPRAEMFHAPTDCELYG